MGAVRAETLNQKAPAGFRPMDHFPESQTVLIFAKPLPLSVFLSPPQTKMHSFYTASFHSEYQTMNETVNGLCMILQEAGHLSLPIPSYSPIRFHKGEPHGLVSLKHAAVEAGLGKMGKNTLLIHPTLGNITRLGGLMTTMPWPEDPLGKLPKPCPESCTKCMDACPVGALSPAGIDKTRCMVNCVEHILMPPRIMARLLKWTTAHSRFMTWIMDLLTISLFNSYGISCFRCLTACPHFPGNRI